MCVISINILVNLFLYEIKELEEYKNQGQEVQFLLLAAHVSGVSCCQSVTDGVGRIDR